MDTCKLTRGFPKEETYSLTDQVVRSSRSITAKIAEGFRKRIYESEFKKHLIYAMVHWKKPGFDSFLQKNVATCKWLCTKASAGNMMRSVPNFISFMKIGELSDKEN